MISVTTSGSELPTEPPPMPGTTPGLPASSVLLNGPPKDLDPHRIVKIDILRDSTALRKLEQLLDHSAPNGAVFLLLGDSTGTVVDPAAG